MNERTDMSDMHDNGRDGLTDEQRARGTAALAEAAARDDERERQSEQNSGRERDEMTTREGGLEREGAEAPRNASAPREASADPASTPLFTDDASDDYRSRWNDVQSRFVDDPQDAVKEADALVADLMKDLARSFADERSGLEGQWSRGDDVSTEDLRVALQRYRSFFGRLLSI